MGLAASQARFLAITARKTNCELRSMEIAQEKLSVTNELTKATEQYQNALNATKLVWDSDGTGQHVYDVSYDLLMTPSAANYYDPYLVTNSAGKIALTTQMAKAAQDAGISPQGGSAPSEAGRNAFIEALTVAGVIPGSTRDMIVNSPGNYSSAAGVGGIPLDKTEAFAVSNAVLAQKLQANEYNLGLGNKKFTDGGERIGSAALSLSINGSGEASADALNNLTLGDLLENEYTLVFTGHDNADVSPGTPAFNEYIKKIMGEGNLASNQDSLFGKIAQQLTDLLGIDDASTKALDFAYKKIMQNYDAKHAVNGGKPSSTTKSWNAARNSANKYNAITYTNDDDLNKKENAHIGLNLTNLVNSFLTYYAQQLTSGNNYNVSRTEENSYYVTDDMNFVYQLGNANAVTEKDLLITDFYNSLYNNLCANGWTAAYGDNLKDDKFLANALKNGHLFISTLGTDGYYHQDVYNNNGYLVEVTDDDAVAQAELEYEITKSKLNYKEEKLDIDMKNVDMEISSLSTEYDTVKNLISKNVEKVFTMFQG